MKKNIVVIICWLLLNGQTFGQMGADKRPETFEEKISYSIGYDVTSSISKMGVRVVREWFTQGVIDALTDSSGSPIMTNDEMELLFQELQKRNFETTEKQQLELAGPNIEMGKKYIESQMALNPKLVKTESGLVYEIVKKGKGKSPIQSDQVVVKYKGTLINGTVFDQTYESSTATFEVAGLIAGWVEALLMMNQGAIYKLIIPADLAYGASPPPGTIIEAGSTLVFEIELVKIEK